MADYELEQRKAQQTESDTGEGVSSTMSPQAAAKSNDAAKALYTAGDFKAALESKDATQISVQLNGISLEQAREIACNSTLMGLIESQDEAVRNSIYDKIYMGASSSVDKYDPYRSLSKKTDAYFSKTQYYG